MTNVQLTIAKRQVALFLAPDGMDLDRLDVVEFADQQRLVAFVRADGRPPFVVSVTATSDVYTDIRAVVTRAWLKREERRFGHTS